MLRLFGWSHKRQAVTGIAIVACCIAGLGPAARAEEPEAVEPYPAGSSTPANQPPPTLPDVVEQAEDRASPPGEGAPGPSEESALSDSARDDSASDRIDDMVRAIEAKSDGHSGGSVPRRLSGAAIERRFLRERLGLSFGAAYTALYQRASQGVGPLDAAVGDLDLFFRWRAFGREGFDSGAIAVYTEWRHRLGTRIAPFNLSKSIGTLWETTPLFTEQPFVPTQVFWDQEFARGRARLQIGKLDPAILYFGNRINDANLYFVGLPFGDNPSVFFPGAGLGLHLEYELPRGFQIRAGVHDANGRRTGDAFQTIQQKEFWWALGAQHQRQVGRLGVGNYRFGMWYAQERTDAGKPDGGGFALSADQELGSPRAIGFLRYEWQSEELTSARQGVGLGRQGLAAARQTLRGGVVLEGLLGGPAFADDVIGAGFAWGQPYRPELRDQWQLETFYRIQVTPEVQLTPSVQLFVNPSRVPDTSTVGVFSVRLRLIF